MGPRIFRNFHEILKQNHGDLRLFQMNGLGINDSRPFGLPYGSQFSRHRRSMVSVKVTFIDNPIRKDGSVISRQVHNQTMDFDKVLNRMGLQTGLSETDMRSVFTHFVETLALYLQDGNRIQTPLGTFSLKLSQPSASLAENVERKADTAKLSIRLRADKSLVKRLKNTTTLQVVDAPGLQRPSLSAVENTEQPAVFNAGRAGEVLHLTGRHLAFLRNDLEVGVFFVSADQTETRAIAYSRIGTVFIDCKIPAMPVGQYTLQIRTRPTDRKVRTGVYNTAITIL